MLCPCMCAGYSLVLESLWNYRHLNFKVANSRPWKYLKMKVVLESPEICFIGFWKFLLGNVKCVPPVGFFGMHIFLNSIWSHRTLWGSFRCSPRPLVVVERSLNSNVTEDRYHACASVCCVGTSLLIHTATEQSSASYYGEQGLHYVDVKGESCLVPRGLFSAFSRHRFPDFLSLHLSSFYNWCELVLS